MTKRLSGVVLAFFLLSRVSAQVNLQTGGATFSLPMFSWQDDKSRLSSIVALSYNSGNGLKVNEISSNAGQGWNLLAGGEIVRLQAGEPDDQVARNGNDYDVTKYPSGILYASIPAANGCPSALTKYPIYGWKNQVYAQHNAIAEDKQLDYFSFQFNGKAGMFVLDPSDMGNAKSLGDTKMKITFQQDANLINQGIRTKITSFNIQDVDGLIYKFTLHGLTKVLRTEYTDDNFTNIIAQPNFKDGKVYYQASFDDPQIVNPWIIGSWHLTEIEDALTHRKIFFNYVNRTINTVAGYDISFNETNKNYGIVSRKKSITQTQELSSITFPDGHTVAVNYGSARYDLPGQYAIASVDIAYQGRYISKYELKTSYFILNRFGNPTSDYEKRMARLCLKSVRKIGVDLKEDTPPYLFDYYTGSNASDDFVPPPYSYAKDIWGFFNGDNTKGYWYETLPLTANLNTIKNSNYIKGLCYLRDGVSGVYLNAKQGYARNGLLRQIVYPTGGTLTYQYEQNTGLLNGINTNVGGVHVSQTSATDGGYSNGCANPLTTNYNYVMNGAGSASSLWGLEMPVNTISSFSHYQPEWKSYKWSFSCFPFGCCYWHFQYPGIQSRQQAVDLAGWQKAMVAISPILNILSVLSTIKDIATVVGGGSPVSLIIDVIVGLVQVAVSCIGDQSRDRYATIHVNADLNSSAPLPTQFKRVEVVEGAGGNGKTVQEFTSDDDYPIWFPTNTIYSGKQRFAPWAYGLPKNTIVYDANGNKVKETNNIYNYMFAQRIHNFCGSHGIPCGPGGLFTTLVSCKCEVQRSYSQRSTKWTDYLTYNPDYWTSSNADMKVDFYGMYTGRTLLDTTVEKVYKTNDPSQAVTTTTSYVYNTGEGNSNYDVSNISTVGDNGETKTKTIRYSGNFSYTSGVLYSLIQNNIISEPVVTSNSIYKNYAPNSWQTFFLNEQVTEFAVLANGDIKPYRMMEQRFDKPKPTYDPGGSPFAQYQEPGNPTNPVYKVTRNLTYDAAGNLIGLKDEGGRSITNIYDYNDKYITASVINADALLDKCAYTSFETSSFGGWTMNGSPISYTNLYSVTGKQSFLLSTSNSFSAPLNTSKAYKVSFWSGAVLTVSSGAVLAKSVPGITGFVYYEYDIPQGASTVTVSSATGAVVDELRVYPATARMRTTTYDPLIGKTAECDENNRITYYEYDNLGRLRFIKDEKQNIVKMNEYNNISAAKQNGCPGTYYNRFISQIYVKDNCGPGYQGSEVTYTVPANVYSSTLSQEDADAQAEYQLLSNGQAYANTNGTCQPIYYNVAMSVTDTTESCSPGYIGGPVTYTVPAGRYTSLISQADANDQAQDDLDANADNYINTPPNAICLPNFNPEWTWLEGASFYCQLVGGVNHLFILETDINPNSPTYNQTRWSDVGPSDLCPPALCNPVTCSGMGEAYACINDFCEMGIRVNTFSYWDTTMGEYICIYHYEYSDGSWSATHYEWNPYPCAIQ